MKLTKEEAVKFFGPDLICKKYDFYKSENFWVAGILLIITAAFLSDGVRLSDGSIDWFEAVLCTIFLVGGSLGALMVIFAEYNRLIADIPPSSCRVTPDGCWLKTDLSDESIFFEADDCYSRVDLSQVETAVYVPASLIDRLRLEIVVGAKAVSQEE